MSATEIWNAGWLTQNTQRTYPFAYDATLLDSTGAYRVPNALIVAANITARSTQWLDVSLEQILVSGTEFVLFFTNDIKATVPRSIAAFTSVPVENAYGFLTIGQVTDIQDWPLGLYTFPPGVAEFDVDVVRPPLDGFSSIRLQSANGLSEPLYGDVTLVAGNNLSFAFVGGSNAVRLDAIPSPDLTQSCGCDGGGSVTNQKPIYSVNGLKPDANGNVQLEAEGCFEFRIVDGRLVFKNNCAEPCCDCTELDKVMESVQQFVAGAGNLSQLITRMETGLETLRTAALSSSLPTDCSDPLPGA
jgi:hypothetical protein